MPCVRAFSRKGDKSKLSGNLRLRGPWPRPRLHRAVDLPEVVAVVHPKCIVQSSDDLHVSVKYVDSFNIASYSSRLTQIF